MVGSRSFCKEITPLFLTEAPVFQVPFGNVWVEETTMPDLSIECHSWCATNESWERKVLGSKGKTYTVRFEALPRGADCSHGFTCECEAFRFGGGKPCKHIKAVEGERCAWNFEACMGSSEPRPANGKCPKCGGELRGIRIAV